MRSPARRSSTRSVVASCPELALGGQSYVGSPSESQIATLVERPAVMSLIDQFLRPSYLLWVGLAINLDPGETRQAYHCDDKAHSRDARLWPHGV